MILNKSNMKIDQHANAEVLQVFNTGSGGHSIDLV